MSELGIRRARAADVAGIILFQRGALSCLIESQLNVIARYPENVSGPFMSMTGTRLVTTLTPRVSVSKPPGDAAFNPGIAASNTGGLENNNVCDTPECSQMDVASNITVERRD